MIRPTVGRIVDYYPFPGTPGAQPHAAQIAYVWHDRMVNLSIADHCGRRYERTSVTLHQDGDPVPVGQYCAWMDYQKDQAKHQAKHEGEQINARVAAGASDAKMTASPPWTNEDGSFKNPGCVKPKAHPEVTAIAVEMAASALYAFDPMWDDAKMCPVVGPVGDPLPWSAVAVTAESSAYRTAAETVLRAALPHLN